MPTPIHTIAVYRRLHTDNICAVFLLQEFGEEFFPGIKDAKVELWDREPEGKTADEMEKEGYLLVDMGEGKFDHHHHDNYDAVKTDCASTLVAKYLDIDQMPALRKLLTFVKRDDLEGRGIVSKDVIDRMFGLPALILNLVKAYPSHPDYVIDIVKRIFQAHYFEQYTRTVLMPLEFETLKNSGKAVIKKMSAGNEELNVVLIETDSNTMAGFLRAVEDVKADIVVVRRSTGHINIITKDRKPRVDFRFTVRRLREEEALKKGIELEATEHELEKTGRIEAVKEWYYDTAANTLQNGGAAAVDSVPPTSLQLEDVEKILLETLPGSLPKTERTTSVNGKYR